MMERVSNHAPRQQICLPCSSSAVVSFLMCSHCSVGKRAKQKAQTVNRWLRVGAAATACCMLRWAAYSGTVQRETCGRWADRGSRVPMAAVLWRRPLSTLMQPRYSLKCHIAARYWVLGIAFGDMATEFFCIPDDSLSPCLCRHMLQRTRAARNGILPRTHHPAAQLVQLWQAQQPFCIMYNLESSPDQ